MKRKESMKIQSTYKNLIVKYRPNLTPGRRQSKMLSTIDGCGSRIDRNSVFVCHLSPAWRQMAIKNTVSIDFWSTFLDSIGIFDCRLPGVNLFMSKQNRCPAELENLFVYYRAPSHMHWFPKGWYSFLRAITPVIYFKFLWKFIKQSIHHL